MHNIHGKSTENHHEAQKRNSKNEKNLFKEEGTPFNKGEKEELKVLYTNNGCHYIRPTNSEVAMAK